MDVNNVLRAHSASDCSPLSASILGGHSLGAHTSDGEGTGGSSTHEGSHGSLSNSRRTSRVWKYFRMVDNCHYVCCLCNFIGAYTNTTNMRKHIQNHHPEIFQDILDHTRPSNRLHFLRSFQPAIFPSNQASLPSYQHQSPFHLPSSSHHPHMNASSTASLGHYADSDAGSGVGGEEGDASSFAVPHCSLFPQRDGPSGGDSIAEPGSSSNHYKVPNPVYKCESKAELLAESLGEDRKVDLCSLTGTSFPSGLNENSLGSGEGQGVCDEVSVPLSPEQFLSEEMDPGVSPSTPSQRPESYKLRHNNHLTLVLESLAGDESFMDVTLTAQGRAIKAHKSILSAVSPYFKSVLKENPCQHPIIIMPRDIRFEELNNIISYVYKGEMTVAAEELSSLLKTAEILQVTGLSPTESGRTASGIISQMQGLPSGVFPNVSGNNSSSTPVSSKRIKQSHSQSRSNSKERQQQQQHVDSQSRIDPLEFLNADMTCVKEEIPSDTEEGDQLSFPLSKEFPAGSGASLSEPSDSLGPTDSSRNSPLNRRKSLGGSPRPQEDPTGKPFNPGEVKGVPIDSPSTPTPPTGPHVCPHCLETHRPTDALQSHLRLKHPSKSSFVCSCGRVFVRQTPFSEHQKKCKG